MEKMFKELKEKVDSAKSRAWYWNGSFNNKDLKP